MINDNGVNFDSMVITAAGKVQCDWLVTENLG